MTRVQDVIAALDRAYPPQLAAEWDTGIGLTCGDPDAAVDSVLLAVDAEQVTIDETIGRGADLLVTHHPLLFRPVQSVAADTAKGALVHRMISCGVAHFAAHTNADSAVGGVNDALGDVIGLIDLRPLVVDDDRPGSGHTTGSGRVGELAAPLSLRAFLTLVADRLPPTVSGVRAAGDPDRMIATVAICGGAGDGFLSAAATAGADVYLTSDLRHHVVAEFVADPRHPAVVDVAHWAGEWPWLTNVAALLGSRFPDLAITVSTARTDPWTLHLPAGST